MILIHNKLLWKYAQKIDKNNKPSDTTKSKNPKVNPLCTLAVWSPKKVGLFWKFNISLYLLGYILTNGIVNNALIFNL